MALGIGRTVENLASSKNMEIDMINRKKLIELVEYKFQDKKYYINIIDCEEYPTEIEKDYPFNINGKIIFFDEICFRKLLENYIDIDNDTTDEIVDVVYDIKYLKNILRVGGQDEERKIIETLNLMQDALVILDISWHSKYGEFINMANYFTFSSDVSDFIEKYDGDITDLIAEITQIDEFIINNSEMIDCLNKFVKLPFEPIFL
jgi:hypothetical protein